MAPPVDATGDVVCKKNKGLKNHKKAQKEKALAKRTAAAEKITANKVSYAPVAPMVINKTAPVQGDVIGNTGSSPMVKTSTQVIVESSDHSRHDSATDETVLTNLVALTGSHTTSGTKTAPPQPHLCTHLPVVVLEDVLTGSKNNTLTKVAGNSTKLEHESNSISYPKTAPPSPPKLTTTQISLLKTAPSSPKLTNTRTSMLNPTAPAFLFGKITVAQTPPAVQITLTKEDTAPGWPTENAKAYKKAYGVIAQRKALEAALNENMETPRQRLIRCKYRVSVDAEFHPEEPVHDLEWAMALIGKPVRKCFDDNGFVITPVKTGLTEADLTIPSALDELFAKVKAEGISKISAPISTAHISPTPGATSTKKPVTSRTLASVEAEMRLAAPKRPSHAPSFADPGIVKYTFHGQDFDNTGNPLTETVSQRVLGWLEDQPTDPPELSPGSSRQQSREASPLEPGEEIAPLTFDSKPPSSEGGQVWPAQESLPWDSLQDGYAYRSGVPVYPYIASVVRVSEALPGSCGEPE
ncbi:uncharacterized protein J4E84_010664 [Alternaria hordeiaustralica]|uniref:uncharacterized protein n=1 Tax=Alternaria hordeiaustralica TaxID=1187925 RepID=UPI0020C53BBE|nr:uncharacterized protein J4E84_010664 [Alternaria hordeiaustralica]KAI4674289.1 hypothetical protein J4E84_010664 [Alternaria hordeiaustralica]